MGCRVYSSGLQRRRDVWDSRERLVPLRAALFLVAVLRAGIDLEGLISCFIRRSIIVSGTA